MKFRHNRILALLSHPPPAMRQQARVLVLSGAVAASAILAAACGASSPSSPGAATPEFRVMTFNIQHGLNGAGKYGLDSAVQTIAKVGPDLVGVQELTRNHPYYN